MPTHASWADANRAVALLRAVLDLDPNDDVRIESAPGPNRNAVFRVVTPRPVFLKLYRPGSPADRFYVKPVAQSRSDARGQCGHGTQPHGACEHAPYPP